jgi:hypothetical protein
MILWYQGPAAQTNRVIIRKQGNNLEEIKLKFDLNSTTGQKIVLCGIVAYVGENKLIQF